MWYVIDIRCEITVYTLGDSPTLGSLGALASTADKRSYINPCESYLVLTVEKSFLCTAYLNIKIYFIF